MTYFSRFSTKCMMALALTLAISFTTRAEVTVEWVEHWGFIFELFIDEENYENNEAHLMGLSYDQPIDYDSYIGSPDSTLYLPSYIEGEFHSAPLTLIMYGALGGCEELKIVVIPSTVKTIDGAAFANSNVETIICERDYYMEENEPITIGEEAFKGCKRLNSVDFYRPVTELSPYAFMDCPVLNNISFSEDIQLRSIGACAFANCVGLTDFYMPDGVEVIGPGAFANCYNLKQVSLPSGLVRIGNYAFAECGELDNVGLPSSLNYIGDKAFLNCSSLSYISIPKGVVNINEYAFCCCPNLSNLRLHNDIKTIGKFAFAGCSSLPGINLPNALTTIGEDAFLCGEMSCEIWNSENLRDSTMLDICLTQYAWGVNNGRFDHIKIGSNVTAIGDQAFAGHLPDTVICMAPVPPVYSKTDQYERVFALEAYQEAVLRVPRVLIDTYRNADG